MVPGQLRIQACALGNVAVLGVPSRHVLAKQCEHEQAPCLVEQALAQCTSCSQARHQVTKKS